MGLGDRRQGREGGRKGEGGGKGREEAVATEDEESGPEGPHRLWVRGHACDVTGVYLEGDSAAPPLLLLQGEAATEAPVERRTAAMERTSARSGTRRSWTGSEQRRDAAMKGPGLRS